MNFKDICLVKEIIHSMGYDQFTKWQKDNVIEKVQHVIDNSLPNPNDSNETKEDKEKIIFQASELIRYIKREIKIKDDDDDADDNRPLIYRVNNLMQINDIFLPQKVKELINVFMVRYQKREILKNNNLPWGNKLLLSGEPGNGKTVLAGAIAKEFALPFFQLDSGLIEDWHLGSSARNIVKAFDQIKKEAPCVFLFDECDSYATKRLYDSGGSVEMSHALNIMLQQMDALSEKIVFVATTNVHEMLDPAFLRRFSMDLHLSKPNTTMIKEYINNYQKKNNIVFPRKDLENAIDLAGKPWSKVEEYCQAIHQNQLLGLNIPPRIDICGKVSEPVGFKHSSMGSD